MKQKLSKWWAPISVLLLGAILRLFCLGSVPAGLQQDEAFPIWNSLSLLRDGIDSSGSFLPVYLADWGDGHSALYSWLMMPLLLLNGLKWNAFIGRLPQALIGILTIWVVYLLFRKMFGDVPALWCSFLLTICPWHVTMCRWGLDANLAPGFLVFGLYFFVLGLEKPKYFLLSALTYGLSLYCYAAIWPIVPVMILCQVVYCALHGKISLNRYTASSTALLFLLALPLMLFVVINSLQLPPIRLPFMTIPIMSGYRGNDLTLSLPEMWSNFKRVGRLLVLQDIGTPYDLVMPYGLFYDIGRVFIVIGFVCLMLKLVKKSLQREFCFESLIFFQLVGAGINGILIAITINRINSLYIPLVFCEAYGVWSFLKWLSHFKKRAAAAAGAVTAALYLICLAAFQREYYTDYKELVNAYFAQGVQECAAYAVEKSSGLEAHPDIIFERGAQWPRFLLFCDITAPEYLEYVTYKDNYAEPAAFRKGDITFYNGIDYDNLREDAIYIIYFPDVPVFEENYTLRQFYDWYVAVPKKWQEN
ncbi:MAG: glycosyltransferase family 39 protein [Bacteroidales bacterium]|nr:glycosyltransferase family 39 protein [Lachnoclostridium sp.]MCM1383866.1 glycosyltransferase family 39 protein [Lachnoclostridium sp.]MCM1464481.1 glycosyltransferase family 39 protein [Bacteroidales bacterium]